MTEAARKRIQEAFKRLNGKDATEELELEIKAREELIKRLEHPLKLLKLAALKEKDKRKAKVAKFAQYDRYEDAHELYGYGEITYEELKEVEEYFEKGADFIENEVSPVEYAERMLKQFTTNLHSEVRSFKFDLLPPEEQARILEEQAKATTIRMEGENRFAKVRYTPTCKQGYDDCIYDPAYIYATYPEWYRKLYGDTPPEKIGCEHCENGEHYDDEDK